MSKRILIISELLALLTILSIMFMFGHCQAAARPDSKAGIYYCSAYTGGVNGSLDSLDITANTTPNAYDLITGDTAIVSTGDYRSGIFRFDASDLSTEVAADTAEFFYVAPDDDATGATGAWVRLPVNSGGVYFANSRADIDALVAAGVNNIHLSSDITLTSALDMSAYTGAFRANAIITLGAYDFTASRDFDGINGCLNLNSTGVAVWSTGTIRNIRPELYAGVDNSGNSGVDSYTPLQACITAANTALTPIWMSGHYYVGTTLMIGNAPIIGDATVTALSGFTGSYIMKADSTSGSGEIRRKIDGITLDGNSQGVGGLHIDLRWWDVEHCKMINGTVGIRLDRNTIKVSDCLIKDNEIGVWLADQFSSSQVTTAASSIAGNQITENVIGVLIHGAATLPIYDNVIQANILSDIELRAGQNSLDNVSIHDNYFELEDFSTEWFEEDSGSHSGLNFAYGDGWVRGTNYSIDAVAAGSILLDDDTTNYIEVNDVTGTVSSNTSAFTVTDQILFTGSEIPLFTVVTASGAIDTVTDMRPKQCIFINPATSTQFRSMDFRNNRVLGKNRAEHVLIRANANGIINVEGGHFQALQYLFCVKNLADTQVNCGLFERDTSITELEDPTYTDTTAVLAKSQHRNCRNYTFHNSGSSTILAGNASLTGIAHGLDRAPAGITLTATGAGTSSSGLSYTNVGATTFDIIRSGGTTGNLIVYWEAHYGK